MYSDKGLALETSGWVGGGQANKLQYRLFFLLYA